MPTQSAARKAWNEAMKATAGATALPPGIGGSSTKRRSDRHKKGNNKQDRRTKARKTQQLLHGSGEDGDEEYDNYKAAIWVDALEGIDPTKQMDDDVDDEYDELEELDGDDGTSTPGTKRKRGGGRGGSASAAAKKVAAKKKKGILPKRLMPRSLASILMEEASRGEEGTARQFLDAEARVPKAQQHKQQQQPPQTIPLLLRQPPARKFCPVTGMEAKYREPKTGIPYANYRALEQIRERPPPWMMLHLSGSGTAAFYEAAKSIRNED